MSTRIVVKNVSYSGGFIGMLVSLAARAHALPTMLTYNWCTLVLLAKWLAEMDSFYMNIVNAIVCSNINVMVSI